MRVTSSMTQPSHHTEVKDTSPGIIFLDPREEQSSTALDVERICRLLVRFAYLTEEIDHEKTSSLPAQKY